MTNEEIEAAKAAFLAKGGAVKTAPEGIAYGVSADADKVKRIEARQAREDAQIERNAERQAENVREAYHTGGQSAAMDAFNRWRY